MTFGPGYATYPGNPEVPGQILASGAKSTPLPVLGIKVIPATWC